MMRSTKKLLSLSLAVLMLFSVLCVFANAEEDEKWLYIDGENITRAVNTVIVYKGVATTGQNSRGYNVVVDKDGNVTDIIEAGLSEGENLAVPESGMVISAAGTKMQWLKSNIKKGSRVYYDAYTKRLFLLDSKGGYDPYFTKQFNVTGEGNYIIANIEADDSAAYTYDIAVDSNGTVVARGSNCVIPEGGFLLSASVMSDMQKLVMYAPVGAKCVVAEGIATLTYDQTMLNKTLEILLADAKLKSEQVKAELVNTDHAAIDAIIAKYELSSKLTYKTACEGAYELTSVIDSLCYDAESGELRAAFHEPLETDIEQVRETVRTAKAAGLNSLFLKLSNGYGTFIPLPSEDKFTQDSVYKGFDLLKAYITVCEEENIELGLSIDVYYNKYASIASPDWLSETNRTEKGLSDKYYSPSNEEFKEYFIGYLKYIVANYEVKNIMLDYLRYPRFSEECDFGYDYKTLQLFSEKYGIKITEADAIKTELFNSPHWSKWVEYRMSLVTDMARAASEAVRETRSDVKLFAISARDSVDHFYMQDTTGWLEEGIFDGICLALYNADPDENDDIDGLAYYDDIVTDKGEIIAAYTGKSAYFFTALEASQTIDSAFIAESVKQSRDIGSDGFIFSNFNDFIAQGYHDSLKNSALKGTAYSPISYSDEFVKNLLDASKEKISGFVLTQNGCDQATAEAALARINEAVTLLDNGLFDYEEAVALENDIAMIFASSIAKNTVVSDFEAITKSVLLHRETAIEIPDESGDASEEVSEDESKVESGDASEIIDMSEESEIATEQERGIEFGTVLMYVFVGFALVAAVAAMIVSLKRRKKRPQKAFMPKAGIEEAKDDEE